MTRKYFDTLMERWQEKEHYFFTALNATSLVDDDLFTAFAHINENAEARELLDDLCFMAAKTAEYSDLINKLENKIAKIENALKEQ